jgi:hypothetical protein
MKTQLQKLKEETSKIDFKKIQERYDWLVKTNKAKQYDPCKD